MTVTLGTVLLLLLGTALATVIALLGAAAAQSGKGGSQAAGCLVVGVAAIAAKLLGLATVIAFVVWLLRMFGVLP
jgi:hypothetical protein